MKHDYILERSPTRRRTRRWLYALLLALLLASISAVMLSRQNGKAEHQSPGAGDTHTVTLDRPLTSITTGRDSAQKPSLDKAAHPSPSDAVSLAAPDTVSTSGRTALASPLAAINYRGVSDKSASANSSNDKAGAYSEQTSSDGVGPLPAPAAGESGTETDLTEGPQSDSDFDEVQTGSDGKSVNVDVAAAQRAHWLDISIKSGDTLSAIFSRNNLPPKDWMTLAKTRAAKPLLHMRPGQSLQIRKSAGGRLARLVYAIDSTHTLRVTRHNGDFKVNIHQATLERRRAYAQGTVKTSLYLAGMAAGLAPRQIMQLTKIFSWKIDFARQVHRGDRFTLIYNQIWHKGEKLRDGDIVAAEFTLHGDTYQAFRYRSPSGTSHYYAADGASMRRALLRAPLRYRRISSPFNRHRMHPILHIVRPHLGTDYAAATGTPVHAAGDGRIEFAGRKGGYGNVVVIRHNADYETVYGHLHDFAKGIHAGAYVKQNRVIGHVGQTGLATGPHLHFGVRVDGRFQNPRSVALPHAKPLPERYLAKFKHQTLPLLARLKQLDQTGPRLASNP